MKTMTCRQMGGMCDTKVNGASVDEMIGNGMKHVEAAHPEMAASIKSMPKDAPLMIEWQEKFMKEWAATPDNA